MSCHSERSGRELFLRPVPFRPRVPHPSLSEGWEGSDGASHAALHGKALGLFVAQGAPKFGGPGALLLPRRIEQPMPGVVDPKKAVAISAFFRPKKSPVRSL